MNKSYKDTFKSAAWYYARYRAEYPVVFFEMLKTKYELTTHDRIMDLGCGTGQIAIPLSRMVKEVVAIDPEPQMLEEGKILAQESGVHNIGWIEGGSEDIGDVLGELGTFKLVTIGTAFHWMNGEKTLNVLYQMIINGGGIVIASMNSAKVQSFHIEEVIKKWLGEERRAGSGLYKQPSRSYQEVIKESKFPHMETWQQNLVWNNTVDSIIGVTYSTSYANPNVLGDKKEAFEKDLRVGFSVWSNAHATHTSSATFISCTNFIVSLLV